MVLSAVLLMLLGGGVWSLEQQFGLITLAREGLADAKKGLAGNDPRRGVIYDRNLKQMAVNMQEVSVYLRSREIESIPHTLVELAGVLPVERQRLQEQLERGELRLWAARGITEEQEMALKALRLPGVYLQRDEKRYYPAESQAAHLLGYAEEGIGLAGVEYSYDRLLADRKQHLQQANKPLPAVQDLVLTVDLKMQAVLEQLLDAAETLPGVVQSAVYMLEGGSGELLAAAQRPSFNPNSFAAYRQEERQNLFLQPMLLPGRFRLLFRDAAAMIAQATRGEGVGIWSLNPLDNDLGSALRLWEWLGLGEILETDFEAGGANRPVPMADRLALAPFGKAADYGMVPETSTPLGVLTALSVLFGGGEQVQPFVVKKIVDIETGEEIVLSPRQDGRAEGLPADIVEIADIDALLSRQAEPAPARALIFQDSLLARLEAGPYWRLQVSHLLYAILPAGGENLHLLLLLHRDPKMVAAKEDGDGDHFAATLRQLVSERLERLSMLQQVGRSVAAYVIPEEGEGGNYPLFPEELGPAGDKPTTADSREARPGMLPDLTGFSLRKSLRLLQGLQLDIKISGTGWVVGQEPPPGTLVNPGQEFRLILQASENLNLDKLSKRPAE